MIIQIPRGTSIVLRFDSADTADADTGQTITLLSGGEPAVPVAAMSRLSAPRSILARGRTMLLCGTAGLVVAAFGMMMLNTSPRAEPSLNLPRHTAWNDNQPGMPDRVRAELAQGPTVVPPDAPPSPSAPGQKAGAPPSNPFGLE